MQNLLSILLFLFITSSWQVVYGQERYRVNSNELLGSFLFWGGSYAQKINSERLMFSDYEILDRTKIWSVDQNAIDQNSNSARKLSDVLLYSTTVLPFSLYLNNSISKQGPTIALMAIEAYFINDGLTNYVKISIQRTRPYVYNRELNPGESLSQSARYSFFSGHTSNTACFSFFTARIITDLHPDSKFKPVIWALAASIPAVTGYLRYKAGRHFPTDVIVGYLFGASIGFWVPELHKKDNIKLRLGPGGVSLAFQF